MRIHTFVLGAALALALFLFGQRKTADTQITAIHSVVDLTHSVEGRSLDFTKATPASTRIEAPAHYARGLWTLDQIPPERLIAPLIILDVTTKADADPDYELSVTDIAQWEKANGQIPLGAIIMVRTGWASRWNSRSYRNADANGVPHYPGYSQDAATFLVNGRNALSLGIDTLSVDGGHSASTPVHDFALAHSVYPLENVAALDKVPGNGAMAVVAPTKLAGGAAGPVRIFALLQ
ncbi:MAG TPA: cyclase family protein [Terriglobales bacterium]|nr:cyclase family protein [Terriglobales bacterium]